jgi:predicted nuclease with TOPRIM domain
MKSTVLYCHLRKFYNDSSSETEALKTKLTAFEAENSKLKETLAQQDKELLLVGQQQSIVQVEASKTIATRARAESRISEFTIELENLQATHGQLQEDHSILKKDLSQLEERHTKVLEQLKGNQIEAVEEKAKA